MQRRSEARRDCWRNGEFVGHWRVRVHRSGMRLERAAGQTHEPIDLPKKERRGVGDGVNQLVRSGWRRGG